MNNATRIPPKALAWRAARELVSLGEDMCVEKKTSRKTITQFGTPMDFKGKFIVLDGPDGCGKSTQTQILRDYISSTGVEAVSFRDPGGTHIGEKIYSKTNILAFIQSSGTVAWTVSLTYL